MPLRRKLLTFARMNGGRRLLVVEAALMLGLARLALRLMPFRRIAPWLARAPETEICNEALAASICEAVTIAARNVPWNAVCLPQALVTKAMLARRGYGSSFHLGANFDGQGRLIAHAWLQAGGTVIIGANSVPGMTPLARFG